MRFVTWNLDWWARRPMLVPREDLLLTHHADVVALQEVKGSVAKSLRSSHSGVSIFSQELHTRASWRWMGCGLLLADGAKVLDQGVVATLPKPQRSVWARVELAGREPVTFVSWHTPNAAGDGRPVKMAAYEAMSQWLATAPTPLVLGADLNTWHDPVDLLLADPDDPHFEEREFVGADPSHGLTDAFRTVLTESGQLDRLRVTAAHGPLAVSHRLQGGAEHRMDRIFASDDLRPVAGGYDYPGAEASGSDHALHWIDFE